MKMGHEEGPLKRPKWRTEQGPLERPKWRTKQGPSLTSMAPTALHLVSPHSLYYFVGILPFLFFILTHCTRKAPSLFELVSSTQSQTHSVIFLLYFFAIISFNSSLTHHHLIIISTKPSISKSDSPISPILFSLFNRRELFPSSWIFFFFFVEKKFLGCFLCENLALDHRYVAISSVEFLCFVFDFMIRYVLLLILCR